MDYNHLIGMQTADAEAFLKNKCEYKIISNFSDKQKSFDTRIIIRVINKKDYIELTEGAFLVNLQ